VNAAAQVAADYAVLGLIARCELLAALDNEDDTPTT
jgi:hypothetical protein